MSAPATRAPSVLEEPLASAYPPSPALERASMAGSTRAPSLREQPRESGDDEKAAAVSKEHAEAAPPPMGMLRAVGLIATCTTAMLLNTASSTSIFIALPTIGNDLDIPAYRLQWVISAYALSSGCLLLFFGRIADLYGRQRTFLLGAFMLGVFSLGCGFAQNEIGLDVLRGLQGMGGAAIIPAALGILAHAFPPSRLRSLAFATFAAGAPIGAGLGSVVGGILTQLTAQTWRSDFFFLTGLCAVCFVGALLTFERDDPPRDVDRRVDWLGAFLVTAALVLIVFVLSDGSIAPAGWGTSYIVAFIVLGVVLLAAWVAWERFLERAQDDPAAPYRWWAPPPLLRISLLGRAHGRLAVVLAIAFLEWCAFLSLTFWLQLYYQDYARLTPILTMVRLIPMFVTGVLCNVVVALVVGHVPVAYLIALGTALTGTANVLFAVIEPAAPYWRFGFPAAILCVFGADFVFATGTLFVARVCAAHEQSVGGALFQTLAQLGGAFGLAISTIVYDAMLGRASARLGVQVNADGSNAPPAAQLEAYRDAFWTSSGFAFLGAVLALVFLLKAGVVGHREDKPKEIESQSQETLHDNSEAT